MGEFLVYLGAGIIIIAIITFIICSIKLIKDDESND